MRPFFINPKRISLNIYIIFLYFLIALVATLPLIFNFSRCAPSYSLIKEVLICYKYNWWLKKAIFEFHVNPFYCSWISYPTGVNHSLNILSISISWFFLPFLYFFSLATTHNLIIISSLILSAYGAYLLVKHLTQDKFASFFSGVIFGFSPYLLGVALNGWTHAINVQWIPFYILNLIKTFEQERKRNAVFAGLFLSLSFYCTFYYFMYLLIFTSIFFLYHLWLNKEKAINIRFIKNLLLLLAVFILTSLPLFYYFKSIFESTSSYFQHTARLFVDDIPISADLLGFFSPFFERGAPSFITRTTYLGYLVLILSFLGVFFRKKQVYLWLWTGLVFLLLALGPYLKINDQFIFSGFKIPLPSLILDKLLPFWAWEILRVHLRATCLVMLSLAILSGYGVQRLLKNLSRIKKVVVASLLSILVLFEFLIISPIPYPMPLLDTTDVPSFYYELAEEEGVFAILDWPTPMLNFDIKLPFQFILTRLELPIRLYPYYQTIHNKKILVSYSAKRGLERDKIPFLIYHPFPALLSLLTESPQSLNLTSSDFYLLRLFDIKYITVHNNLLKRGYGEASVEETNSVLEKALGKPKYYPEDELCVYKLYDKENPKTEEDLVMKYTILGDLYLEDKEYRRAKEAYQQALKINPDLKDIQVKLRRLSQWEK